MAASVGVWALCVQAFFQSFAYGFFITWFPAFLEKGYGVKLTDAGDMTMLPLLAVTLGSFAGGYLLDLIYGKTRNKWWSRSGVSVAALGLCALATLAAAYNGANRSCWWASSPRGCFSLGFAEPVQWSATIDLTGPHSRAWVRPDEHVGEPRRDICPMIVGRMITTSRRTAETGTPFCI